MLDVVRAGRGAPCVHAMGGTVPGEMREFAGPLAGLHALVLGTHDPDFLCELLHGDCASATCLREIAVFGERDLDLVFVPSVRDAGCAARLPRMARHALVRTGRLIARVEGAPSGEVGRALLQALRQEGFVALRTRPASGAFLVRADLPMFGLAAATAARPAA